MERLENSIGKELKTGANVTYEVVKPVAKVLGKYTLEEMMRSYWRSKLRSRRII